MMKHLYVLQVVLVEVVEVETPCGRDDKLSVLALSSLKINEKKV